MCMQDCPKKCTQGPFTGAKLSINPCNFCGREWVCTCMKNTERYDWADAGHQGSSRCSQSACMTCGWRDCVTPELVARQSHVGEGNAAGTQLCGRVDNHLIARLRIGAAQEVHPAPTRCPHKRRNVRLILFAGLFFGGKQCTLLHSGTSW